MLFDAFCCRHDITFIEAERCATGDEVEKQRWTFKGLFKYSSGLLTTQNFEESISDAIVYVPDNADFISSFGTKFVGHYIEYNGEGFRVERMVIGEDLDCCKIEFYKLFLKRGCIVCQL